MNNNDAVLEHIITQLRAHFSRAKPMVQISPQDLGSMIEELAQAKTRIAELEAAAASRWKAECEQSGCRKEDAQACGHNFVRVLGTPFMVCSLRSKVKKP